jgi:alkanesulfonate monooxygenase SsuD/methylene tetrahydromethanopterin reductase-like flavin-dependent oxidoreductase (luciferase family)
MRFGAHLPLIGFSGPAWETIPSYVDAARDLGFSAIAANDHLVFQRPWLDGLIALASVIGASGSMDLATTVALPVVRGPIAMAKAAAAIDILSGGRLHLGVGPGSSARDYDGVGLPYEERWPRFDESLKVLRSHLANDKSEFNGSFYSAVPSLEPRPGRPVPIWIGSWGSDAGLRRVVRYGDGWLASAYNTTPELLTDGRRKLDALLEKSGKDPATFPCALSTMWTYVTKDRGKEETMLTDLAKMLNRPVGDIAAKVLIGPPDECAAKLSAYAAAGVDRVFIWPLADEVSQLQAFARNVASGVEPATK